PSGGFVGESKSAILSHLTGVPEWTLVSDSNAPLPYPFVLKPDVGERGKDVAIIRNEADFARYFATPRGRTIAQKYVDGMEFGVFYYRYPGEAEGHIFAITEKRFPTIAGDGSSTIRELVLRDERAVCLANLYLSRLRRSPDDVPSTGES